MMSARITAVLPLGWRTLAENLCQDAPWLQATLLPDITRFSQPYLSSGHLASAFTHSLLAWNGCPLEFTVSTARPQALSCTLDPFLPLYQQQRDIETFHHLYHAFGATSRNASNEAHFHRVAQWQKPAASLKFGSWLGRKYSPQGVSSKVYSEILPGGSAGLDYSAGQLAQAGLTLLMVGYYPEQPNSPVEYYFQWHSAEINVDDIRTAMHFFHCDALQTVLTPLLQRALAYSPEPGLFPPTTYGFSVVYHQQQLESFTVFTIAPRFFGDNEQVSVKLNALLVQENQAMPLLWSLIQQQLKLQFNVLGFSVNTEGSSAISCTFSPQNQHFEEVTHSLPRRPQSPEALPDLLSRQTASGAFLSHVRAPNGRWYEDENAFVTAQVLRTLDYTPETASCIDNALDFLTSCATKPYHFAFWPAHAHPSWMGEEVITPDVDDTAIITELLYKYRRISLDDVRQTLVSLRNYQLTRVDPRLREPQHQWAECLTFYTWMDNDPNITQLDCCVNTNVLILLHILIQAQEAPIPDYHRILAMLNGALAWSGNHYEKISALTPYYAHPNEWLHALKYADYRGIKQVKPLLHRLNKWQLPAALNETPLYCRHDGQYLWTSADLNAFRLWQTRKHYEYFSHRSGYAE